MKMKQQRIIVKILAVMLAVAMLVILAVVPAMAEEGPFYKITYNYVDYTYSGSNTYIMESFNAEYPFYPDPFEVDQNGVVIVGWVDANGNAISPYEGMVLTSDLDLYAVYGTPCVITLNAGEHWI